MNSTVFELCLSVSGVSNAEMWLLSSFGTSDPCGRNKPVCDPCSVSICEEIRRTRAKRGPTSKNCRVCSGPGNQNISSGCQPELIGTWITCHEATQENAISSSPGKNSGFIPPNGLCDKLTFTGLVWAIRNEITHLQASHGVPVEEYGFINLMNDIFVKTFEICSTIYCFATNCLAQLLDVLFPMLFIIVCVLRFILDRGLRISMEEDLKSKLIANMEPTSDESGPSNKRRKTVLLPHNSLRTSAANHLPEIPPESKQSHCLLPGGSNQKCNFIYVTCKTFYA